MKKLLFRVAAGCCLLSNAWAGTVSDAAQQSGSGTHGLPKIVRRGRVLSHPASQPAGTSRPVSYELGKLIQLDREHVLLTASMREQGGQDFCVGNDGFVLTNILQIDPTRAIPINRPDTNYILKSGQGIGVQAKYPGTAGFMPLDAKSSSGESAPGAGTGFYLSTAGTFVTDRSRVHPKAEWWIEILQLAWDGKTLKVTRDALPEKVFGFKLGNIGFRTLRQDTGLLCPVVSEAGIVVLRFEYNGVKWAPVRAGKAFGHPGRESEPSIVRRGDEYLIYTRGADPRGRVYSSTDGLNYQFLFEHPNKTVPQVLNQGLDGSLYLVSNTSRGALRNPLFAFALREKNFVDPAVIHDEQNIHKDSHANPEQPAPFVDHGIAENVFIGGRWRHFLLYRVCDVRETNGQAAPPTPYTGLYLAELIYGKVGEVLFRP